MCKIGFFSKINCIYLLEIALVNGNEHLLHFFYLEKINPCQRKKILTDINKGSLHKNRSLY